MQWTLQTHTAVPRSINPTCCTSLHTHIDTPTHTTVFTLAKMETACSQEDIELRESDGKNI